MTGPGSEATLASQLPAIQVVLPLVAAPLCVLIRHRRAVQVFATLVTWGTFAAAVGVLREVNAHGTIRYALGDWAPPWGIELHIDMLSALLAVVVAGIGAIVLTYAPRSVSREIEHARHYLFYTAYLLCLTGLLGICVTGDLFNVFVFLEVSALSSYVLISLGRDTRALTAAFRYLIMGTIGATFILIGIGLMYAVTGTLNMLDMADRLAGAEHSRTLLVGFGFFCVGVSLKMALFPLHAWLPNAYTYAPSVVTAFLAATATKVSVYVLLRFLFTVYGVEFSFEQNHFGDLLLPLSLAGIFVASTVAIFQRNVKRLLAWSSVAQIGYMGVGISLASVAGLTGGIVHIFNHALMKGSLFMATGCIFLQLGSVHLDDLRGMGKRMPVTMFLWVLGGLGLIGVPLTGGFISKWYLLEGLLEIDQWPIAAALLISSLLALVYVWRVVEIAYFREPSDYTRTEAPLSMLVPTAIMVAASIYFGVFTEWSAGLARQAAEVLLGGSL